RVAHEWKQGSHSPKNDAAQQEQVDTETGGGGKGQEADDYKRQGTDDVEHRHFADDLQDRRPADLGGQHEDDQAAHQGGDVIADHDPEHSDAGAKADADHHEGDRIGDQVPQHQPGPAGHAQDLPANRT